jgi:hypothetical protein
MKHQGHFKRTTTSRDALQIGELIADLDRIVRLPMTLPPKRNAREFSTAPPRSTPRLPGRSWSAAIILRLQLPHSKGDESEFTGLSWAMSLLALLIRMHPEIRRDLARLGQLDHVDRRRVAALPA